MTAYQIKYSRSRFPERQKRADGTFGCRGCGRDIPKGRLTWCSLACKERLDPGYVKLAVRERDKDICQRCGKDCSRKAQRECRQMRPQPPRWQDCGPAAMTDPVAYHDSPAYRTYFHNLKAWQLDFPRPEYDHIVAHRDGGLFVLENIRTLCRKCHKARTAQQRKEWRKPDENRFDKNKTTPQ